MRQHLDRRLSNLFIQLVVCYQTGLHLEIGATMHQSEPATHLYLNNRQKICNRNSAHSSTIPCLYAYPDKPWQEFLSGRSGKPEGHVYLEGSECYRRQNATMVMPDKVNLADMEIDGSPIKWILREKAIEVLNEASASNICPQSGLKKFAKCFQDAVADRKGHADDPEVKSVLEFYHDNLPGLRETLEIPATFDMLLGLNPQKMPLGPDLRNRVCHLQYLAIRNRNLKQALIHDRIKQTADILKEGMRLTASPDLVEEAFRHVLVEKAPNEKTRLKLKHFFNLPSDSHEILQTSLGKQYTEIKVRISKEDEAIARLFNSYPFAYNRGQPG